MVTFHITAYIVVPDRTMCFYYGRIFHNYFHKAVPRPQSLVQETLNLSVMGLRPTLREHFLAPG